MRYGRVSRNHLAKSTGISQPTVTRIVDQLLDTGILVELAGSASNVNGDSPVTLLGRPTKHLELDGIKNRYFAIQVGVSQTRITPAPLAVSQSDQWQYEYETPTSADGLKKLLQQNWKNLPAKDIDAVVISLPGVVDEENGQVLYSPNLNWTQNVDFPALIKSFCPAKVYCIQEIRALALGQLAVEPESRDFLLVDFGSGVGGAAIIGGSLYRGPLPLSGELGHTPVPSNKRKCGCGSTGCIETLVSRKGLVQTAVENKAAKDWNTLSQIIKDHGIPDWLKPTLDDTAIAISSALNVLGLRQVVLTGCINELPESVSNYLADAMKTDTLWARFGEVTCKTAPRHRLMGMITRAIEETLLRA